jgi:MFS family permease
MESKDKKKPIRIFLWASFLNDMGSDMIYPVWPLFVTTVLHANMAALGFLDGLGEALVSLSQAASGFLSDRIRKRKVFIWSGYLCGAISRVGYSLSGTWRHLIPFRILDRAGKMRGAPRDAMIADLSAQDNRGRNFGLLRAMDNLGAVCGILLCIVLAGPLGYRNLFLLAALPTAVGTILVFSMIKEQRAGSSKIYKGLALKDLDNNFKLFLFLSVLFALGSFSYSFLLIYAKTLGFKMSFVPVLYLVFTAAAALFSLPFGRLSDKIGRKPVLVISYILWGMVSLCFVLFRTHAAIFLAFFLYGLHKAALEPVQKTFVAELAPAQYRASVLGGFQMVTGLCALPASVAAGLLWDRIGMLVPLFFSLGLTIVSTGMLIFVKEKQQKSAPRPKLGR